MFLQAYAYQTANGPMGTAPLPRARLQGRPGTPASLVYPIHTRIRRQVLGVRACLAEGAAEARLDVLLDGQPVASWVVRPSGDRLEHLLADLDLPRQAEPHQLTLVHHGPGDLILQDLIVRWRDASPDPIGDELILAEGNYWDEYIRLHVEAGDLSILDGEVKGTHPTFLDLGITAPDLRDEKCQVSTWSRREIDFAFGPFRERAGGLGLDLGCGIGAFTLQAARQGARMIGIDVAARLLKTAQDYAAGQPGIQIDYVRAEGARLPFRSETFDVIGAKDALHHIPEIQTVFTEIRRLLKPQGICVLMDHVRHSPFIDRAIDVLRPIFLRRILRRYPRGPVPPLLSYPSPFEGAGHEAGITEAFEQSFKKRRRILRFILVPIVWSHAWYAYGRLRWLFVPFWRAVAWAAEMASILAAGPANLGLRGEEKR